MARKFGKGKNRMDKKGSIQDLFYIGAVILFFAIAILIGFRINSAINDNLQANADVPTEAKTAATKLNSHFTGSLNNSFIFMVVGMMSVMLILATMVRFHPIFIPIFIIVWLLAIFVGGVMANIYMGMATNAELSTYANQLGFVSFFMKYLPFVIGIFGIILMIVMYKLWGNE